MLLVDYLLSCSVIKRSYVTFDYIYLEILTRYMFCVLLNYLISDATI